MLKSFFSIGFRSYIKHFLGAILLPFRPSLPWCIPIRELPFEQKESGSSSRRKRQLKSSFSMGFRSYIRHFLGANLLPFRPSLPWCFPIRSCHLNRRSSRGRSSSSRRKKLLKSFFSIGFRSYIKYFLGAILLPFRPSLPWCFPIRELPFEQKEQQEQEQQQEENVD